MTSTLTLTPEEEHEWRYLVMERLGMIVGDMPYANVPLDVREMARREADAAIAERRGL